MTGQEDRALVRREISFHYKTYEKRRSERRFKNWIMISVRWSPEDEALIGN